MAEQDPKDERLVDAATRMRADHGPDHPRHAMWEATALLLDRLAELAPYWAEPYAAPFVPIIEAGVHVATEYLAADRLSETTESAPVVESHSGYTEVYVVFDGPPGAVSGRFVETEDGGGRGLGFDDAAPGAPKWEKVDTMTSSGWQLGPFLVPSEHVRRG